MIDEDKLTARFQAIDGQLLELRARVDMLEAQRIADKEVDATRDDWLSKQLEHINQAIGGEQ